MKVTADALHSFTPDRRRAGAWRRSTRPPKSRCSTTGWPSSGRRIPTPASRCCSCPSDDDPPPAVLARLVELLEVDEDRSVVPVRVFWIPGGLPTRSKVVSLLSGRDTYRPPKLLQRSILRKDAVARPGGRRRAGQGVGIAAELERHHRRREPARLRAVRHAPRRRWRSNASSCGCWAPSTSRRDWSSRRCWRPAGFARDSRRSPAPPWRRPARCSTSSRRAGADSRST